MEECGWTIIDANTEFNLEDMGSIISNNTSQQFLTDIDVKNEVDSMTQLAGSNSDNITSWKINSTFGNDSQTKSNLTNISECDDPLAVVKTISDEAEMWKIRASEAAEECLYWKQLYERKERRENDDNILTECVYLKEKLLSAHGMLTSNSLGGNREISTDFHRIISDILDFVAKNSVSKSLDMKISLTSFTTNDIALFFPTPRGDFLAFHIGAPHHYLSEESKALIGQDKHFRKQYVLGKIIFKEEKISSTNESPYKLPIGTVYYEVSVSSIASLFDHRI